MADALKHIDENGVNRACNRTNTHGNTLYKSVSVGRKRCVEKQGEVVKDFMVGTVRIKINDAYCRDKTPTDIEDILSGIAIRVKEQLTAQETAKSVN